MGWKSAEFSLIMWLLFKFRVVKLCWLRKVFGCIDVMPQVFKFKVVSDVRSASKLGSIVVKGFCARFNVRNKVRVLKVVESRLEMSLEAKESVVNWTLFVNMFRSTTLKPMSFNCKFSSLIIRLNASFGTEINFKPLRFNDVKLDTFGNRSKSIDVN